MADTFTIIDNTTALEKPLSDSFKFRYAALKGLLDLKN